MIADIIAQDSQGRDVVIVTVRGTVLEPDVVSAYLRSLEESVKMPVDESFKESLKRSLKESLKKNLGRQSLGRKIDQSIEAALESMELESPSVPFGMVVDLDAIHIKKQGYEPTPETQIELRTVDMLRPYEPEFGKTRIHHPYLVALVEAWLHDLARHWKLESPPGSQALAAIGLLPRLKGGTTQTEVPLGIDSVR